MELETRDQENTQTCTRTQDLKKTKCLEEKENTTQGFLPFFFITVSYQENNAKDKEVGKVAAAVPVIISRALEMFLKSLLTQTSQITQSKHTRTMTQAHLRQCINTEKHFDFLKDLAAQLPALRPSQEQGLAKGVWTSHRWQDLGQKAKRGPTWKVGPSKKVGESQIVTSQMQDSMETQPDSDDSEPELVICLDKGESPSHISRWNTHSGRSRSSYFSNSCTRKILSK